jgi:hypothetical protein
MCRSGRRRLQLDDSPSDPLPDGLAFEVAAIELGPKVQTAAHRAAMHQVGALGRCKLGIVTMLPDQQVGAPRQMSRSEINGIKRTLVEPSRSTTHVLRIREHPKVFRSEVCRRINLSPIITRRAVFGNRGEAQQYLIADM